MNWPQQNQLPNAKLALAFSDPAGANACLAIAKMKLEDGYELPFIFTNRPPQPSFELDFPIRVSLRPPEFKDNSVKVLFTGTSHPDSSGGYECHCILNAKREGIYTVSFIDHWINFKLRFSALPANTYPDEIWVVDDAAKNLAIEEGLPTAKIKVSGNPYHYFLKNYWKSAYGKGAFLAELGIRRPSLVILYAPDPISLRPGSDLIGFSELEVLADLLGILKSSNAQTLLIVKLHPLQPEQGIKEIIRLSGYTNSIILKKANVPEVIKESDLVIGFYSNILLEAIALNKEVIRYFPGNEKHDLLRHTSKSESIKNKTDLENKLQQIISAYE